MTRTHAHPGAAQEITAEGTAPMDPGPRQRYACRLRSEDPAARAREAVEDAAEVRGSSMSQRGARLAAVCRAAWAVLRIRPDFERAVSWQDPRPADFEAIWQRLMASRRTAEGGTRPADGSG